MSRVQSQLLRSVWLCPAPNLMRWYHHREVNPTHMRINKRTAKNDPCANDLSSSIWTRRGYPVSCAAQGSLSQQFLFASVLYISIDTHTHNIRREMVRRLGLFCARALEENRISLFLFIFFKQNSFDYFFINKHRDCKRQKNLNCSKKGMLPKGGNR